MYLVHQDKILWRSSADRRTCRLAIGDCKSTIGVTPRPRGWSPPGGIAISVCNDGAELTPQMCMRVAASGHARRLLAGPEVITPGERCPSSTGAEASCHVRVAFSIERRRERKEWKSADKNRSVESSGSKFRISHAEYSRRAANSPRGVRSSVDGGVCDRGSLTAWPPCQRWGSVTTRQRRRLPPTTVALATAMFTADPQRARGLLAKQCLVPSTAATRESCAITPSGAHFLRYLSTARQNSKTAGFALPTKQQAPRFQRTPNSRKLAEFCHAKQSSNASSFNAFIPYEVAPSRC